MEKARVNGVDIAYEVKGDGEPVLLIHGAFIADAMRPLAEQPGLGEYRVIWYHRRGYGESGGEPPPDVATHASDARALVEHLGAAPAHVVGHSYGGATALQLASDAPEVVGSLVLLEAGIPGQIPSAEVVGQAIEQVVQPIQEGDAESACDRFLRMVLGGDYRQLIADSVSPAAWAQVLADADDAFQGDLGSLQSWAFGPEEAARISCPALLVLGEASDATARQTLDELGISFPEDISVFDEMIGVAQSWLPQSELVTLDGLNHALQMRDAAAVANAVAPFLARHRMAVTA